MSHITRIDESVKPHARTAYTWLCSCGDKSNPLPDKGHCLRSAWAHRTLKGLE